MTAPSHISLSSPPTSPLTALLLLQFLLPLAGINWSRTSGGVRVEEIANISGPKTTLMFQERFKLTSVVKTTMVSVVYRPKGQA